MTTTLDFDGEYIVVCPLDEGIRCRRLKQYVHVLRSEMPTSEDIDTDKRVYAQEVDDAFVVKVLKDDYAGRKKAEQLEEYIEERLIDDNGS